MKILVTGASGHLGAKLTAHLDCLGHQVTGLDLVAAQTPVPIHAADLSCSDPGWASRFKGQDVVIHLAADRAPDANWASAIPSNMDAVLNLFAAAAHAAVPRVVFASSNWVLGGYRFRADPLGPKTTPMPINPYGMTKLMGERIGAHCAAQHGMTVICTRIGWTQWTHANQPGPHMAMGRWGQLMWLSDRDFLNGMTAAATAPVSGFSIVNLMSNNPGMRWSLQDTRSAIGFTPQDGAPAQLPLSVRLKEAAARVVLSGLPRVMAWVSKAGW